MAFPPSYYHANNIGGLNTGFMSPYSSPLPPAEWNFTNAVFGHHLGLTPSQLPMGYDRHTYEAERAQVAQSYMSTLGAGTVSALGIGAVGMGVLTSSAFSTAAWGIGAGAGGAVGGAALGTLGAGAFGAGTSAVSGLLGGLGFSGAAASTAGWAAKWGGSVAAGAGALGKTLGGLAGGMAWYGMGVGQIANAGFTSYDRYAMESEMQKDMREKSSRILGLSASSGEDGLLGFSSSQRAKFSSMVDTMAAREAGKEKGYWGRYDPIGILGKSGSSIYNDKYRELKAMFNVGTDFGMFDDSQNYEEVEKRFTAVVEQVSKLSKLLKATKAKVMQAMAEVKSVTGLTDMDQVGGIVQQRGITSQMTGMSMEATSAFQNKLTAGLSGRGVHAGAMAGWIDQTMRTVFTAAKNPDIINPGLMQAVGGPEKATAMLAQEATNLLSTTQATAIVYDFMQRGGGDVKKTMGLVGAAMEDDKDTRYNALASIIRRPGYRPGTKRFRNMQSDVTGFITSLESTDDMKQILELVGTASSTKDFRTMLANRFQEKYNDPRASAFVKQLFGDKMSEREAEWMDKLNRTNEVRRRTDRRPSGFFHKAATYLGDTLAGDANTFTNMMYGDTGRARRMRNIGEQEYMHGASDNDLLYDMGVSERDIKRVMAPSTRMGIIRDEASPMNARAQSLADAIVSGEDASQYDEAMKKGLVSASSRALLESESNYVLTGSKNASRFVSPEHFASIFKDPKRKAAALRLAKGMKSYYQGGILGPKPEVLAKHADILGIYKRYSVAAAAAQGKGSEGVEYAQDVGTDTKLVDESRNVVAREMLAGVVGGSANDPETTQYWKEVLSGNKFSRHATFGIAQGLDEKTLRTAMAADGDESQKLIGIHEKWWRGKNAGTTFANLPEDVKKKLSVLRVGALAPIVEGMMREKSIDAADGPSSWAAKAALKWQRFLKRDSTSQINYLKAGQGIKDKLLKQAVGGNLLRLADAAAAEEDPTKPAYHAGLEYFARGITKGFTKDDFASKTLQDHLVHIANMGNDEIGKNNRLKKAKEIASKFKDGDSADKARDVVAELLALGSPEEKKKMDRSSSTATNEKMMEFSKDISAHLAMTAKHADNLGKQVGQNVQFVSKIADVLKVTPSGELPLNGAGSK